MMEWTILGLRLTLSNGCGLAVTGTNELSPRRNGLSGKVGTFFIRLLSTKILHPLRITSDTCAKRCFR